MLSLEECRKIDPSLKDCSDDQVREIRDALYEFGKLAIDLWLDAKGGSKNPLGVLKGS